LIVSNHLSYLDILVFSAVSHCAFVSKQEVRSWPVVGWVATLSGAVYIDRSRRSDTQAIQPEMQASLSHGLRLTMFPEGTSTDGSRVLHFHSSLFQPAIDLNAPVTAAAIRYAVPDGDPARDACYWGDMNLVTHLFRLLQKEAIQATVTFSEQHFHFTDRKEAARVMRQEVERLYSAEPVTSAIT
jgi:lyso-ornithine lipid O-acyltransferase